MGAIAPIDFEKSLISPIDFDFSSENRGYEETLHPSIKISKEGPDVHK